MKLIKYVFKFIFPRNHNIESQKKFISDSIIVHIHTDVFNKYEFSINVYLRIIKKIIDYNLAMIMLLFIH